MEKAVGFKNVPGKPSLHAVGVTAEQFALFVRTFRKPELFDAQAERDAVLRAHAARNAAAVAVVGSVYPTVRAV